MRRQLAVNSNTALQDIGSIQQLELLGKGTFGKVYRGLWRGTVVAVSAWNTTVSWVYTLQVLDHFFVGVEFAVAVVLVQ
jgi:predicted Ser/Thr protein kinase